MTFRTLHKWIAAIALAAATGYGPAAHAQVEDAYCGPDCYADAQWFAPVDFDYNCLPIQKDCGYIFNYNRLVWTMSGERVTIGARGATETSEVIYYGQTVPLDSTGTTNPFAEGDPPPPYTITNGVQEAPPDANFGWGTRYEFGYQSGGCSWTVGILDGPSCSATQVYGFNEMVIPNSWPGTDDLPLIDGQLSFNGFQNGNAIVAATGIGALLNGIGSAGYSTSHFGFGSVHVNFSNGGDFLFGFRDYLDQSEAGVGTIGGPGIQVTALTVVNGQVTAVTTLTGGDGIPDNLDGDTVFAYGVLVDADDNVIGLITDFGDLANFNVAFDQLTVRNRTETDGVELMKTWDLDNSHLPVKEQRNHFQIGAGVRYLKIKDTFFWDGRGGILGRSYQETIADNNIVGPQIRANWNRQDKKWNLGLDARCMLGYNVTNMNQKAAIGENLAPGQPNSLLYMQPTYASRGGQNNEFSPTVELRAEARYQVTRALALKLGYTAMYVDNITRSSEVVVYQLPDLGLASGGQQDIFINGVDFGFEILH
ncbi:MAG: BBP7 family outer membrane beta-barrel protein [Planctomycetales bacterium]|nr:BBP7 family outer membrane beta-barrel protein [Planctomycetales bacterium]